MASIALDRLWINDGTDLSEHRAFLVTELPTEKTSVQSEVRTYANGRRRVVSRAGGGTGLSISLAIVSAADVQWLRDRLGALVLVRDPFGRRVWGTYASVDVKDNYAPNGSTVSLSLESVTHSEAV